MFTRCPACHTVHPVNANLLARADGKYRCGKCKKLCSALDSLFDEWPAAGERPTAKSEPPVLGLSIDLEDARKSRLPPGEPEVRSRSGPARFIWIAMALVITVFVALQLSEFHEKPLLDLPLVQSVKDRLGMQDQAAGELFLDLSQIQLVSRELTSHPSRENMLRLSATIVNRAPETQPYPDLEVVLLDVSGQPVSHLRFSPSDYLAEEASKDSGMTPQAYLPLVLDLPDPGSAAVGFELNFL